ncbi:MAG: 23S rRNA (adenine(2503)-C(2))-methyltransferase RlmN [Clostridia bacterium]|nr:23S rRNA (adenine(2503)-C(2))-methyltransferase RlmN [Clostridia bacterium]MBP5271416.1 23S rRNA (adenine(2503)-C(2))-methyltransferase RlmN [Clostridia bacterium]
MSERKDIRSMTLPELTEDLVSSGLPKFRAKQVYDWLHKKYVAEFDEMTNLSKDLRETLAEQYVIYDAKVLQKRVSAIDGTVKYLYELNDGNTVETVLMKYKYGYSVCVSSQIGCDMGCTFCASTIGGCERDLRPSEILAQVYTAQRDMDIRVSHLVLMGMGEPLLNYDNVMRFLELLTCEDGVNLSMRHVSLSTCGIVPRLYDLMELRPQFTLSVSLHAPNDDIRRRIMPVAKRWDIETLLKACRDYIAATNRRISFEYAMMSGVNDSDECARELASRLKGMLCHVNLIPANEVRENDYVRSSDERLTAFASILERSGITTTVRRTLGPDIEASCGQLRRNHAKEMTEK